jgi:hypothetical protein
MYYKICTPHEKNKYTGNVCVNYKELNKFNKDFVFSLNGRDIILNRTWVKNNVFYIWFDKKNRYGKSFKMRIPLLSIKKIINAA